jgi:predicted ATPase/class 3 adenylate cyclase/DNA-binding CsgD family transcriptional regulator
MLGAMTPAHTDLSGPPTGRPLSRPGTPPKGAPTPDAFSADGFDDAMRLPAGTVTFLLTDIEGSTRLWEADSPVMAGMVTRHDEILAAAVRHHGGVRPVEQGEGDSVVAVFGVAGDALAAALEAQRALGQEPWPKDMTVRVRMALHTGDVQVGEGGKVSGPAIIRCARLRATAYGGQTVLTQSTRDLVVDRLPADVGLLDLGLHRLKDLGRPERVWQLCHPALTSEFPPLKSLDASPNNLPVQLSSFVGRERELTELGELTARSRHVTLTGSGGCGKTRLALQLAADRAHLHVDGTRWVDFSQVTDEDLVLHVVAASFGLRQESDRPMVETLERQLANLKVFLVLDNCEHVLEPVAAMTERLLKAAPDLQVLATSREPLGIAGETAYRVRSLDIETAMRLFLERADEVRPGFSPQADELEAIEEICRHLDLLPLAIELAAARVRMMHPVRIAERLDDMFRLLTGGSRTALARQQTLEASVAWSHSLLGEDEKVLFRRLSVFAGGFTLPSAEAICSDELIDPYAVLDVLARLVDKSLVQVDGDDTETHYRMLESIRQYGRARLSEADEGDAVRARHLAHFTQYAEAAAAELMSAAGPKWLDDLEQEHDNLLAALAWAETAGAHQESLRLVTALALFWEWHGHLVVGAQWFARVLAHDDGPSVLRSRALWGAAHIALYADDHRTQFQRAEEALAMAKALGDDWTIARSLTTTSSEELYFDAPAARGVLSESIELGRSIGDDWAVADGLKMMTIAWMIQEDFDGVRQPLEELVAVATRLQNKFFLGWCHTVEGFIALHRGEFDEARSELETSLKYCQDVGDPSTGGMAIALLGELEMVTGDREAARVRLESFAQQAEAIGGAIGRPFAILDLLTMMAALGDPGAAAGMLTLLFDSNDERPVPFLEGWGRSVLGAALLASADLVGARSALAEAKRYAEQGGNPWLVAMADFHLAQLERQAGDPSTAEDLHHEALALRAQRGLQPGIAESLEALASLALDHESPEEAVRLLAAAAALRRRIGLPRWPGEQLAFDADLERATEKLGHERFEPIWAEGDALGTHEAVAYASRARGQRKRPSKGWASLTPTENDVVGLAAQGLTNPEIGERLFISRATVKTHLAHIFTKLGVGTRAELAALATRREAKDAVHT